MFYGRSQDIPPQVRRLTGIVEMLAGLEGVRSNLVAEIREQIQRGEYLTEEKLDEAIHRLLCEFLTEEERVS
jgi:hypothetical protein